MLDDMDHRLWNGRFETVRFCWWNWQLFGRDMVGPVKMDEWLFIDSKLIVMFIKKTHYWLAI